MIVNNNEGKRMMRVELREAIMVKVIRKIWILEHNITAAMSCL